MCLFIILFDCDSYARSARIIQLFFFVLLSLVVTISYSSYYYSLYDDVVPVIATVVSKSPATTQLVLILLFERANIKIHWLPIDITCIMFNTENLRTTIVVLVLVNYFK